MKDLPVIVLSDDDSDAPVRIKQRRLVKNGAIVKKNNVQDGKKQTSTNEYQTRKRVPLIVISDDDDDELDEPIAKKQKTHLKKPKNTINNDIQRSFLDNKKFLPITNNKASVQEFQNMGTSKTKKKDLFSDSKTPTWNLIDEETDEEFTEYDEHTSPFDKNNVLPITNKKPYGKDLQSTGNWEITDDELNEYLHSKQDFGNLFDEEANDDEDTKRNSSLEDIAEENGEDLYESDMYSVRSVSEEEEKDSFINDDSTDYDDTSDDEI
ncbi:hypothetical protein Tco_0580765 [Tanacetum coccineum]